MIFLSNKGLFTRRYTRSLNIIESPQAEETEFIPTYSNPLQVRASQGGYGVGIVSQQEGGSEGYYQQAGSCAGFCLAYSDVFYTSIPGWSVLYQAIRTFL